MDIKVRSFGEYIWFVFLIKLDEKFNFVKFMNSLFNNWC